MNMFKRFLAAAAVSFVLIAFTFQFPQMRSSISDFGNLATRPFLDSFMFLSRQVMEVRNHFYDYWNAVEKQYEQQQQINELESKLVHYQDVVLENARLKQLLDFRDETKQSAVGVRIIGYALKPWKKSLLLDKGLRHGIVPQSPLIASSGLVGRVTSSGQYSSQAILITDSDFRVSAMTLTSRVQGMIEGNGTGKLKLRYLSLDDQLQVGEMVVTSGLSDIYPKGLRIGTVEVVERDSDGMHLVAVVRPVVPFSKLEEILCLAPSKSN